MTTYERGITAPINLKKKVQAILILFWAYPAFWCWVWFIEKLTK
jgi:hypothetical protein